MSRGRRVGCEELRRAVDARPPRLHVFGHIHEAYGALRVGPAEFVNASICDLTYRATNAPVVRDLVPAARPGDETATGSGG